MKKNNKALLVTLSAVALLAVTMFGTMAYFTDSEAVTNTFTVGKVDITLDEKNVDGKDAEGKDNSDEDRDVSNKYHLIPGQTYVKDPTVHIQKDSEDCYVFVTVDNQIADIEWDDDNTYSNIGVQMAANGWKKLTDDKGADIQKDGLNVFVYGDEKAGNDVVAKNENGQTDLVVFSEFRIDGNEVGNTEIANHNTETKGTVIKVTAYAVQAAGFDTALDAWNATYGK